MSDFSDFDQEKIGSLRATLYFLRVCCPEFFVMTIKINEANGDSIISFFRKEFLLFPNSTIGLSLTNGITEE
jgi:hypothetical protein